VEHFNEELAARLAMVSEQTGIPVDSIIEFAVAELVNECSASDIADMISCSQS
jgi:hypothetical protein